MSDQVKTIPGVGTPTFKHDPSTAEGGVQTYLGHYEGHDLYFTPDDYGTIYARYSDEKYAGIHGFHSKDELASIANDFASSNTPNPHRRALWVGKMIAIGMGLTKEIEA